MRGIGVIAVHPYPARLDTTPHAKRAIGIARPYAGTQTILRGVGNGQRLRLILEGGYPQGGTEYFLLKDAHIISALQQGRLHVIAPGDITAYRRLIATHQEVGAILPGNLHITHDLVELFL